jgi:hypothetical protein
MHEDEILIILGEMHKGVGGGLFWRTSHPGRCKMPSIGGQFFTRMPNNIINIVMLVNELKIFYTPQWQN